MAGTPQYPRINYPGLEYLATAGDRHVAIDQRISQSASLAAPQSVAATTLANVSLNLPNLPSITSNDGVMIDRAFELYVPQDASGQLQIVSTRMVVSAGANTFDFGYPVITILNPPFPMMIMKEQQNLILGKDLAAVGVILPNPVFIQMWVGVKNNDAANPHSFSFNIFAATIIVRGIMQ